MFKYITTSLIAGGVGGFVGGSYVAIKGLVKMTISTETDYVKDSNIEKIDITRDLNDINKYNVHLVFNNSK